MTPNFLKLPRIRARKKIKDGNTMKKFFTNFFVFIVIIGTISCFQSQIKSSTNEQSIEGKNEVRIYSDNEKKLILMPYAEIPLNKDFNSVSTELGKIVKIDELGIPYVEFISQYKITKFFNGLYESNISTSQGYDDEVFLNNLIVKKYYYSLPNNDSENKNQISENISAIEIFTYKTRNNQNEFILMINKHLKNVYINYTTRFEGMVSGISKEVGTKPKIYRTEFQDNYHINNNTYEPGSVAIWDTSKTKIYLLIKNNALGSMSAGLIVYISKTAWANYVNECEKLEKDKLKKNEKLSDGF